MFDKVKRIFASVQIFLLCLSYCGILYANDAVAPTLTQQSGLSKMQSDIEKPTNTKFSAITKSATKESGLPLEIRFNPSESAIAVGVAVEIPVSISVDSALKQIDVSLSSEGPVKLQGLDKYSFSSLKPGQTLSLPLKVIYTDEGRSVIHVSVSSSSFVNKELIAKRQSFYTIIEKGRVFTGTVDFLNLEFRRLQENLKSGVVSDKSVKEEALKLQTPKLLIDQKPRPLVQPTPAQKKLQQGLQPLADPDESYVPDEKVVDMQNQSQNSNTQQLLITPRSATGTVTVQGTVNWQDENGLSHPAFGMTVQVRDAELIGSELVAQATTDVNGQYYFVVDNDDGFLAGNRDIFVRIRTANSAVSIKSDGVFGAVYQADTGVHNEVPDGSLITENITCANTGTGPACGLHTGASYVASYTASLNAGSFLPHINILWSSDGAYYDGSNVHLSLMDRWDWDVMFHEYGHYVMDSFNFENNPGGSHSSASCDSDARASKDVGVRLAWGESWPTYFGISGQRALNLAALNIPRVGDTLYQDTEDSTLSYSMENSQAGLQGEDNERAIMRLLWDITDSAVDGRDNVNISNQALFDIISPSGATNLSQAWSAIRALLTNSDDLAYGGVSADQLVGSTLTTPASGSIVRPNTLFSWNRNVGCSTTYDGDNFDLVFYDAATSAKLLTIPNIAGNSRLLSNANYDSLVASTHSLVWAVEGRNTSSPATGPYLGENFSATLNQAPIADAGPDQVKECTAPSGATLVMNGNNSSDPDNDPLNFFWTAPGIAFSDPASATPSATFPKGSKLVTLTVDDGIESDNDTMMATVVDTTAPNIQCPAGIVAECTGNNGIPATDPLIAAFLAAATASDICDVSPQISNNAPAFFPLGVNNVTFTAQDDDLNSAMCGSTVSVVDTTPPQISVSVSPTSLWPPNHKMVEINATVTVSDSCDTDPSFVLTSIISNEPDNGVGDGNTINDIQNADFGTPDTTFSLRAERQGGGSGRIYTITYTANDHSGNSSQVSVDVVVAHN